MRGHGTGVPCYAHCMIDVSFWFITTNFKLGPDVCFRGKSESAERTADDATLDQG